jgi:hypothetical protein
MSTLAFITWGVAAMALAALIGGVLTLDLGLGLLSAVLGVTFAVLHSIDEARKRKAGVK